MPALGSKAASLARATSAASVALALGLTSVKHQPRTPSQWLVN